VREFIFSSQSTYMKYYIIKEENELQIVLVSLKRDEAFNLRYGHKIQACTESLWEALGALCGMPAIICDGF